MGAGIEMRIGLDTSVVLRLLVGQPQDQAAVARDLLESVRRAGDQVVVDDLVVAEAYFALQRHYGVPKSVALSALRRMFEAGEVLSTGHAASVLSGSHGSKPGFVDRMIHAAYTKGGGQMATFEKSAGKLPGVKLLK
jgi:predicted nucleic acid-binding protein